MVPSVEVVAWPQVVRAALGAFLFGARCRANISHWLLAAMFRFSVRKLGFRTCSR